MVDGNNTPIYNSDIAVRKKAKSNMPSVIVIGGGIAGVAAAHFHSNASFKVVQNKLFTGKNIKK